MKNEVIKSTLVGFLSVATLGFASAAFNIGDVLDSWNNMGVFAYILPFLLVFAMVYGILNKSKLFGDEAQGVNVILALALGLISLFSPFPEFVQRMAPNLAIGLSVLLAALILLGLFVKDAKGGQTITYGLIGLGVVIFLIVTYSSFQGNLSGLNLWDQYGPAIITLLVLIGFIAAVVKWGK